MPQRHKRSLKKAVTYEGRRSRGLKSIRRAEEVTVSLKESVDVMKQGSWKMALALAFCKHGKVGEYFKHL